jgi:hypothetical protein
VSGRREAAARTPFLAPSARFPGENPLASPTLTTRSALPALIAPALPLGAQMAQEQPSRRERVNDSSRVGLTHRPPWLRPRPPIARHWLERAGAAPASLERRREAGAFNARESSARYACRPIFATDELEGGSDAGAR